MQPMFEILKNDGVMNLNVFIHRVSYYPLHWHSAYEFLLILEGKTSITIGDTTRTYGENDLVLINAYEPHSITAEGSAVMLALQIEPKEIRRGTRFDIDSSLHPEHEYRAIKTIMAQVVKIYGEGTKHYDLLLRSVLYRLIHEMLTRYAVEGEEKPLFEKHYHKLQNVLAYIQDNFRQELTLGDIAHSFGFSVSYLSRLFEQTMGIPFKKYLDSLRLAEAVDLLLTTDKSIDEISQEAGFPNARSFASCHKESYGCLPSEHRTSPSDINFSAKSSTYLDFPKTTYLTKLARYLQNDEAEERGEDLITVEKDTVHIDTALPQRKLTHTFKRFCSVGRASDLLRQNVRNMIIEMQNDIGFEYIKFHGLFDDDLNVYSLAYDGKPQINFDAIDNILDFLLSIRLKPLMQLSFMPKALAAYPNKTTFFKPIITSEPRSNQEWAEFVSTFVSHLLSRYGEETVKDWPFCVWNEPETPSQLFGFVDHEKFPEFYRVTYQAVKRVCPSLKFGSSSVMIETILNGDVFEETFLSDPSCRPDFINFHFYPLSSNVFNEENISSPRISLSNDPHVMGKAIARLKTKLRSLGLDDLPLYLTEWNSTTSHRDLLNDTAFKGSYVARNIIDNYDELDSFGYWSLTDDILELPPESHLFHGGIGLFTKSGIKKPPYYAFQFLGQLGENLLQKGRGHIVTGDVRGFQMVLVNYIHYSDLYGAGELFDATPNNRYAAFRDEKEMDMNIVLEHVVEGTYIIEETIVNRNHGSCYDVWARRYNGEEPTTPAAMNHLAQASTPKFCIIRVESKDGVLLYRAKLKPHEIRLVKLKRL